MGSLLNLGGLRSDRCDPLTDGFRKEFRAVIDSDASGITTQNKQISEHVVDTSWVEIALHTDRSILAAKPTLRHGQYPKEAIQFDPLYVNLSPFLRLKRVSL